MLLLSLLGIQCALNKKNIDGNRLFKEFVKSVRRKCSSREYVPDNLIDKLKYNKTLERKI